MPGNRPDESSVTRDELARLLGEYAALTSFGDAVLLLEETTCAVHLAVVDEEDYEELYAALVAEIAVEHSEWSAINE